MFDLRPVFFILGLLLTTLGVAMSIPALVDAYHGDRDWSVFAASSAVTAFFGSSMALAARTPGEIKLNLHQAFLLTGASWLAMCAFAALPFYFASIDLNYAGAFFEAVSGLTTTGATVIVGLDELPAGILLWRALLQWLGGIGIIVMAIAILPILRIGGMQLFRMESSDKYDKALPRVAQLASGIINVYLLFSALCLLAYWAAGMSFFDAVCHMMTTVSTGGFSTSDESLGKFDSAVVEAIAIVFMFLGAVSFPLHVAALQGRWGEFWRSEQTRGLIGFILVVVALLTLWQWLASDAPLLLVLREVAFHVVSITTTTGYVTADYVQWGGFSVAVFFFLMFVGGCTGSTTGGIKIFRFQVLVEVSKAQLRRLLQPHGIFLPKYQNREISETIALSVLTFVFIYGLSMAVLTMILGLFGLDFVTAISGATSAVSNIGPGLGHIVGPAGTFADIPDGAKLAMAVGMLFGRLEFMTLIVLLTPWFWRH